MLDDIQQVLHVMWLASYVEKKLLQVVSVAERDDHQHVAI